MARLSGGTGAAAVATVLAVDGGQTSTRAIVAEIDGSIRGFGQTGPLVDLGRLRAGATMRDCLRESLGSCVPEALARARCHAEDVAAAYVSATGGWDEAAAALRDVAPIELAASGHDVRAALTGATGGGPGILILSGTGAIAYGRLGDRELYAGGRGYLLADQGSAYDLGLGAIRVAVKSLDGRERSTALVDDVFAHFGVANLDDLYAEVYSARTDNARIAALARRVLDTATAGDGLASDLLDRAARELAAMVLAVRARLSIGEGSTRPADDAPPRDSADPALMAPTSTTSSPLPGLGNAAYAVGGLLRRGSPLRDRLAAVLARAGLDVAEPRLPQLGGAFLEALAMLGLIADESTIERLRRDLEMTGL